MSTNSFVDNLPNKELHILWNFTVDRDKNIDSLERVGSNKHRKNELRKNPQFGLGFNTEYSFSLI